MSDVVDIWKAMKEHKKESRLDALVAAQEEWQEFVVAAESGGYIIQIMSERHWNIYKNTKAVAQYWPSANKWQIIKGGKVKHGSRDEIRLAMREGRL
jgi:hypothetical protein